MINDKIIEAMAQGIAGASWHYMGEEGRDQQRRNARMAIAAIRETGYAVVPADLIPAVQRLEFEVRYFDDHSANECAVIRAADQLSASLEGIGDR